MQKMLGEYLHYIIALKGYSIRTKETYQKRIDIFIRFLKSINIEGFQKVEERHVIKFLAFLKNSGQGDSSIRLGLHACKSFFKYLKRESLISDNIFNLIEMPKCWRKLPDILSPEEALKLVESPDLKSLKGLRDRAILELLYGSGLRVSELCDLKYKHFELDSFFVRVFGKGSKERLVPISSNCLMALSEYWMRSRPDIGPEDYAFISTHIKRITPLGRHAVWVMIKHYAKQCSIENKSVHPHTLRHCFATHLLDNGAELRVIQEMMGHADIGTTGNYLQLSLKTVKSNFEKFHPRNDNEVKIDKLVKLFR